MLHEAISSCCSYHTLQCRMAGRQKKDRRWQEAE